MSDRLSHLPSSSSSPFYWSRWITLSAALLLASGAGTVYAFALFAPLLKSRLRLSQEDTALVASIGAFGLYTSLLAGLHFDRYGPRRTVLVGAVLSGVGFWGLHAAVSTAATDSAVALGLIYAVAQHGSAWILSASVAAPVRNFPTECRGTVVGLSKGFFALSAGFHIEFFRGLFGGGDSEDGALAYIGFLGTFLPCLYIICAVVFNLLPPGAAATFAADAGGSFRPFGALACVTAAWLVASAYLQTAAPTSQLVRWVALLGTVALLLAVAALPVRYGALRYRASNADAAAAGGGGGGGGGGGTDGAGQSLLDEIASDSAVPADFKNEMQRSAQRLKERRMGGSARGAMPEIPLHAALRTAEFWLIFVCFCTVGGAGLLVNANIAQIAQAVLLGSEEVDDLDRQIHCECALQSLGGGSTASAFVADGAPADAAAAAAGAGSEAELALGMADVSVSVDHVTAEDCARVSTVASQQLLVTLFSNGNFLGRMVCGALSDHYASRLPRPAFLAGSLLFMACAQLMLAIGSTALLQIGIFAVGVAFGSGFSMVTTLTVDCFGAKHFATNYGAVDLAPSLGSYIWASRVAGGLYDAQSISCSSQAGQQQGAISSSGGGGGLKVCWGGGCFMTAHIAVAVACVLAAGLAVILWARTTGLFEAAVPDWLKSLAGLPCITDSYSYGGSGGGRRAEVVATARVPDATSAGGGQQGAEGEGEGEGTGRLLQAESAKEKAGRDSRAGASAAVGGPPGQMADSPRSWRTRSQQQQQQQQQQRQQSLA